jgi:hypothetical protein
LFEAEGGWAGVFTQIATVGAGLAALYVYKPSLYKYMAMGTMRKFEWFGLGFTAFAAHRIGYNLGTSVAGDQEARDNHWMAYHYQKALNRMEGRTVLMKAPRF